MASGYTDCGCRECMEIAVSSDVTMPELCEDCATAGCEVNDGPCQCNDGYDDGEGGF